MFPPSTFLVSALFLGILFLLVALIVLFLLGHRWQAKTISGLGSQRLALRRLRDAQREIERILQDYTHETRPPYGPAVAGLQSRLASLAARRLALEKGYAAIQERSRQAGLSRTRALLQAPYLWYTLQRELSRQVEQAASLEADLSAARDSAAELEGLPWQVALQARQVGDLHARLQGVLEDLQARHLSGDPLDAALSKDAAWSDDLARIPTPFFTASLPADLAEIDPVTAADVHALLEGLRPELGALLDQAGLWRAKCDLAGERVGALAPSLASLENTLALLPPSLDPADERDRLAGLQVIAHNLEATLPRLEVDSLDEVIEQAGRLQEAARELERSLKQARRHLPLLEQNLAELDRLLKDLSARLASLGTQSIHPIAWGPSSDLLARFSQQVAALGAPDQPRTPDQVETGLQSAGALLPQAAQLDRTLGGVASQHAALLALLSGPDLALGPDWLARTQKLVEAVVAYDPENWPRPDRAGDLPADLQSLTVGLGTPLVKNPLQPIPETGLALDLEEARQLSSRSQDLKARLERIQSALEQVQTSENAARQQLEGLRQVLAQLAPLARSNSLLGGLATAEISRFSAEEARLASALQEPQAGTVDKKARAVSLLAQRLEQSGNAWIVKLERDLQAQQQQLGAALNSLQAIAPLDEPAVESARRLLASGQAFSTPASAQPSFTPLDKLLPELKRRSDYWQSCQAAQHALDDLAEPLQASFSESVRTRQQVHAWFANLPECLRDPHCWPPTPRTLLAEQTELGRLDDSWNSLKDKPLRAISLVAQLGSLTARYQTLLEKANQVAEKAANDQERVASLEDDLDRLAAQWEELWQAHRDNSQTTAEIRKLLADQDGERDLLKRQYRQGARSYDQVLQTLQALQRKARLAQVVIDDTHLLDVNGRLIAYKG